MVSLKDLDYRVNKTQSVIMGLCVVVGLFFMMFFFTAQCFFNVNERLDNVERDIEHYDSNFVGAEWVCLEEEVVWYGTMTANTPLVDVSLEGGSYVVGRGGSVVTDLRIFNETECKFWGLRRFE